MIFQNLQQLQGPVRRPLRHSCPRLSRSAPKYVCLRHQQLYAHRAPCRRSKIVVRAKRKPAAVEEDEDLLGDAFEAVKEDKDAALGADKDEDNEDEGAHRLCSFYVCPHQEMSTVTRTFITRVVAALKICVTGVPQPHILL